MDKVGGDVVAVEHIGSAHTDAELALLLSVARDRLRPGQGELDLGALPEAAARTDDVADWTRREFATQNDELAFDASESGSGGRPQVVAGGGRVVGTSSLLLWEVLGAAYDRLGFDTLDDAAFKALVLGRIIEPTSKADTIRVLADLGVPAPSLRTIFRCLRRSIDRDYRDTLAKACLRHSTGAGGRASLVLYDVTTLYFETETEDKFRKVGMSKERRVDPQIQVGLLVDPAGFPLEVHCFEGNKAETRTLVPVLQSFQERHGISDMVVVADAGMLSAGNLNALEDAGFAFIVGSRITKAPYDLAEHFQRKGDYFADGQILESARVMGTGKNARERRVVYQFSRKRSRHDDRAINAMVGERIPEQEVLMAAQEGSRAAAPAAMPAQHRNEVLIVGRVTAAPEVRTLPSGDEIVVWRVAVDRPQPARAGSDGPRRTVDALDCVAWTGAARRSALACQVDEVIEVTGALRRRFWRAGGGAASRFEVEAVKVRRVQRVSRVT